jgi:cytochrome c-type protein NapB
MRKEATMKRSITQLLAVVLAAGAYGCATQFGGVSTLRGADAGTPDQAAELKVYAGKRPGSGQPIARTFNEQPPLVPHAIDNFDEITQADNQCLECHSPAGSVKKNAPRIGKSHLVVAGAATTDDVRMDRYQCNTCHVPQVDAKPLVGNQFVGTPVRTRRP